MTTTADQPVRRTYGHWTKPQTPGLPRLGLIGTALSLGGLLLAILINAIGGWRPAAVWVAIALVLLAPLVYRNRADRHGWQIIAAQGAWQLSRRRRQHLYIAGLTGPIAFGSHRLPGLLAPSRLVETHNGYGQPVALVHVPAARHWTVLIRVEPDGSALVDPETVDTWVGYYGRFLAGLGHEPGLVAASVTVETAPDPGNVLSAEVARLLAGGGPALSRDVLGSIAQTYPSGAAAVTAHVALTFTARRPQLEEPERLTRRRRPTRSRLRSGEEMATLIGGRLPGIMRELASTGAGTPRVMSAVEVAEFVHVAFDPAIGPRLDASRAIGEDSGITWEMAGPVAHAESWGSYRHDSAASITWSMAGAPKGVVESRVLEDLLAPSDAVARKRVTIVYRPHDPASAAAVADADVRTAIGRATARAGAPKATEAVTLAAAHQSAREEAAGAGVTRFALLVTATVADPEALPAAAELIDQLGRASRVRLRRCYGSQAASFAAALGVGVVLPAHVAVPDLVRDYL